MVDMNNDKALIKVPIPPELTYEDRAYNPDLDMPQYEWKTVGQYKDERRMDWLKDHHKADVVVVNQEGTPLYALYTSPYGSHEEATYHLFKTLRANMLNEWEDLPMSDEDNKEKMMIEHQHILKQYDDQSVDSVYWYCDKCGIEFIESRVEDKDE